MIAIALRQPLATLIVARVADVAVTPLFSPVAGWHCIHAASYERLDTDVLARAGVGDLDLDGLPVGCILGVAFVTSISREASGPWARNGCLHFKFSTAFALDAPIRCRGRGLRWKVDLETERTIGAQIARHERLPMRAGRAA